MTHTHWSDATTPACPSAQRGAVLVISLMMLLVLSLIGVNAMTTATLEERMAGNQRDYSLALEAAETAVRYGEAWLVQRASGRGTELPLNSNLPNQASDEVWHFNGFATSAACGGPNSTDFMQKNADCWAQAWPLSNIPVFANNPALPANTYAVDPLYVIEYVSMERDERSGDVPPNEAARYMYRVTGRGTGGTSNAEAYVQSVYAVRF